jgi:hypothetical protein
MADLGSLRDDQTGQEKGDGMRHSSTQLKPVPTVDPPDLFDNVDLSVSDDTPVINPGEYDVIVVGAKKVMKFGRAVVLFQFKVVEQCQWFECLVPTFVNLPTTRKLPTRSKLARWLRVIKQFDDSLNVKRLSLRTFRLYLYKAEIGTVLMDRNQKPLSPAEQYSKVLDLKEVISTRML